MNYDKLRRFASEIRINTLKELTYLGFGHYGGSLSVVEVLAVLYGEIMFPGSAKYRVGSAKKRTTKPCSWPEAGKKTGVVFALLRLLRCGWP